MLKRFIRSFPVILSALGSLAVNLHTSAQTPTTVLPELQILTAENANQLQELITLEVDEVMSLALSPDNTILAVNSFSNISLYNTAELDSTPRLLKAENVRNIDFSPDGKLLASGGINRDLRLWDVETGALWRTLTGHEHGINDVAFSPDGKWIVSVDGDLISQGGSDFFPTENNTIRLWGVVSGEQQTVIEGYMPIVNTAIFSPDSSMILAADDYKVIKGWNVDELVALKQEDTAAAFVEYPDVARNIAGSLGGIYSLNFSPDGKRFAASGSDGFHGYVMLWNFDTGKIELGFSTQDHAMNVLFGLQGDMLILNELGGIIRFWDVQEDREITSFETSEDAIRKGSLILSSDGKLLVSGSDGVIRFWGVPAE